MNQKSKLLPAIIVVGIFAIAISIPVFFIAKEIYQDKQIEPIVPFAGQATQPQDVFGTITGTTTAATAAGSFLNPAGTAGHSTTSKAIELEGDTDTALFTMKALTASSTSYYEYEIFGSNDTMCATTTATTTGSTYLEYVAEDINWYDADPTNSRTAGTIANPAANGTGTPILLTNLNWRCLRFDLNGASTTVFVQLKEKSFR